MPPAVYHVLKVRSSWLQLTRAQAVAGLPSVRRRVLSRSKEGPLSVLSIRGVLRAKRGAVRTSRHVAGEQP